MATAFDPRAFQNNAFQIDQSTGRSGIARLQLIELYERDMAERAAARATKAQEQLAEKTFTPAIERVLRKQKARPPEYSAGTVPPIEETEDEARWLDIVGAAHRAAYSRAQNSVLAARELFSAIARPLPAPIRIRRVAAPHRRQRQLKQLAMLIPLLESSL